MHVLLVCFMQWMVTPQLQQSGYLDSNAEKYAHVCLSSLPWWDNLKRIMNSVQPLYAFLQFMDQERIPILVMFYSDTIS
jgi:hypothetical protein